MLLYIVHYIHTYSRCFGKTNFLPRPAAARVLFISLGTGAVGTLFVQAEPLGIYLGYGGIGTVESKELLLGDA